MYFMKLRDSHLGLHLSSACGIYVVVVDENDSLIVARGASLSREEEYDRQRPLLE